MSATDQLPPTSPPTSPTTSPRANHKRKAKPMTKTVSPPLSPTATKSPLSPQDKSPKRAVATSGVVGGTAAAAAAEDHGEREFGGAVGTAFIMTFSHVLLYYVYYIIHYNNGALWFPGTLDQLEAVVRLLAKDTAPTIEAAQLYFSFLGVAVIFAYFMPGIDVHSRPDREGNRLTYRCNAYMAWWVSLAILAGLHLAGIFKLSTWYDSMGPLMSCAIIWGDSLALVLYMVGLASGKASDRSGNHIYDYFMGAILHPRIGILDIKLFAEIRVSWFLLFLNTTSCAVKQYETTGTVTPSMAFMVLAHFLYTNATAKGEHYVPGTFDLFYERFGWMLCFWNFAGVPFLYCKQAHYLLVHGSPNLPTWFMAALITALLCAYYIWDESQAQKNHFRLSSYGTYIDRQTFPSMPYGILHDPKVIKTKAGPPILVDGWWKVARKIHYTADIVMALSWGLACGFDNFIPYFYICFFIAMIVHRYTRDQSRCSARYGADWVTYCEHVPYVFVPGLF